MFSTYEINDIVFQNLNVRNEFQNIAIMLEIPDYNNQNNHKWQEIREQALDWFIKLRQKFKNTKIIFYQEIAPNQFELYEEAYEFDPLEILSMTKDEFIQKTDYINNIIADNDAYETSMSQLLYENSGLIFFSYYDPTNSLKEIIDNYNSRILIVNQYDKNKTKAYKSKLNYIQKINEKINEKLRRTKEIKFQFKTENFPLYELDTKNPQEFELTIENDNNKIMNYNREARTNKIIKLEESRIELKIKGKIKGDIPIQIDDEIILLHIENNKINSVKSCGLNSKKIRDFRYDNKIEYIGFGIGHFFHIEPTNDPNFNKNLNPYIIINDFKINQKEENVIVYNKKLQHKIRVNVFLDNLKLYENNNLS